MQTVPGLSMVSAVVLQARDMQPDTDGGSKPWQHETSICTKRSRAGHPIYKWGPLSNKIGAAYSSLLRVYEARSTSAFSYPSCTVCVRSSLPRPCQLLSSSGLLQNQHTSPSTTRWRLLGFISSLLAHNVTSKVHHRNLTCSIDIHHLV